MAKTTSLERILTSSLLRRYIEALIVVWAPWVLLTEQEAVDASVSLRPD